MKDQVIGANSLEKWHKEYADSIDVITDGAGNVVNRRCPHCNQPAVNRVAYGVCRCLRCGK